MSEAIAVVQSRLLPTVEEFIKRIVEKRNRAGHPFRPADAAATAALDDIYFQSIASNIEFSGRIYKKEDNFFYFTKPRTLNSSFESHPGPKLPNVDNIGVYHSHAGSFLPTDEFFSHTDKLKAELGKEVAYVITPRAKIMKYIPHELLPDPKPDNGLGKVFVLRPGVVDGTPQFQIHQQLFSPKALQRQGSQGDAIKVIQILLNKRPPTVLAPLIGDGIFGPKTFERVYEFQSRNHLVRDGVVGPQTRRSLFTTISE